MWVSAKGSWLAPLLPLPLESSSFSLGGPSVGWAEVTWLLTWRPACSSLPTRHRCQDRRSSACTWDS